MLRSRLARSLSTSRTLSTNPAWPLAGKTIVVAGAGNPPAEGHGIGAMTSIVLAVINAGIHSALPMGFGKMTEEAWAKGIDLNLNAHFHLIQKFLPVFESQQGGSFIHFGAPRRCWSS